MTTSLQATLPHCLPSTPADCRHSRAAFDAAFVTIGARRDLSDAAKRLHAALVSMLRRGLRWTQDELAEHLGWRKRQTVWRAACELVAAGLLRVKRLGLGRPNEYVLAETDDVTQEDIRAKAPRVDVPRSGHQEDRPRNVPTRARHSGLKEERPKKQGYIPEAVTDGRCYGCGGPHATPACERYGYVFEKP